MASSWRCPVYKTPTHIALALIRVNGSRGEGGGQTVRTALALSCITGSPVTIYNIRNNRPKPGLAAQHLAAARILARICNGTLSGDHVGSTTLNLTPGTVTDCTLSVDVGTAGSIPLVLQAIIPVCWAAGTSLTLNITGGTDVAWSPTTDYLQYVLLPAWCTMGLDANVIVERRGYYPKGGGRMSLVVRPSLLRPAELVGSGPLSMQASCVASGCDVILPKGIHCTVWRSPSDSSGAALLLYGTGNGRYVGIDSIYRRGFDDSLIRRWEQSSSVDDNLADMLVVPASVAPGTSTFRVGCVSRHLKSVLEVASHITGCRYGMLGMDGDVKVWIRPVS